MRYAKAGRILGHVYPVDAGYLPLLVVVYFVPTATAIHLNLAHELQQALFRTLLGDFIALSIIGKVIWKSIDNHNNQAALPIAGEA